MRTIRLLLVVLVLSCTPAVFTGCTTPRTQQAAVNDNFKRTYALTRQAYESYLELVVKGKVTKENELRADKAWNDFRTGFALAFKAASNDWSAVSPAETQALSDAFIKLVRSL